ncbi:mitochondrial fission factor-like isoform X4 [Clarias gariepinus]|uniref:mitochondrial fission factor-like isoform X4 n=1 Tax=Clarias gariepinus TaxID=13013 RepID=UPI00234C5D2E|nr:mitochondrial fission factor-like isoform X4 [Clarias gariepinus]
MLKIRVAVGAFKYINCVIQVILCVCVCVCVSVMSLAHRCRSALSGHSAGTMPPVPKDSPLPALPQGLSAITPVLLSPQSVLQVARKLGKQASNRILQTVAQKYSSRFGFPEKPSPQPVEDRADQALKSSTTQEFWRNPEEESGTTVELMVLRRQMMKMNRRITSLEKQNADRRQSEVLLLSLLLSACVINGWLWIRK